MRESLKQYFFFLFQMSRSTSIEKFLIVLLLRICLNKTKLLKVLFVISSCKFSSELHVSSLVSENVKKTC